jgi:hypothetical protein
MFNAVFTISFADFSLVPLAIGVGHREPPRFQHREQVGQLLLGSLCCLWPAIVNRSVINAIHSQHSYMPTKHYCHIL